MTETTWEGVPALYTTDDNGTCVELPEGHTELGYAPGSRFYL